MIKTHHATYTADINSQWQLGLWQAANWSWISAVVNHSHIYKKKISLHNTNTWKIKWN